MALVAGGDVPVGQGGSGWVGELQEGDGVPFQGLVRGVDGRSRELHGDLRLAGVGGDGGGVLGGQGLGRVRGGLGLQFIGEYA